MKVTHEWIGSNTRNGINEKGNTYKVLLYFYDYVGNQTRLVSQQKITTGKITLTIDRIKSLNCLKAAFLL